MSIGRINYGSGIVTDGLVLHLDSANPQSFDGNSTVWRDLSGNGNNGTLVNGVGYSNSNRGVLSFDGTNDYVNCGGNGISFNFGNNFTISGWVYPTSIGPNNGGDIVTLSYSQYLPYASYGLEFTNTSKFSIGLGDTTNNWVVYRTTSTYLLNNWYYVVGTYNGTTVKLFVNSVLENQTNVTKTINYTNSPLTIGCWYYDLTPLNAFSGSIPIVQVYNRALSDDEIIQNYNSTKSRFGL